MKKYIIILCLFVTPLFVYAQAPLQLSYQAIVRNASENIVSNSTISVKISILEGSNAGMVVYSETHSPTTNIDGLVNFLIGTGNTISGDLNTINWNNNSYYIKSETDITGGTNYDIIGTAQIHNIGSTIQANTTKVANTIDYNKLSNKPTTISTTQATKLNNLTVSNALDLDQMKADVIANNTKISFPGFGTTAGTAHTIVWPRVNDNTAYNNGKVGISYTDATAFDSNVFGIKGSMLLSNQTGGVNETSGTLFYANNTTDGFLFYYDNNGDLKSLGTGDVEINDMTSNFGYDQDIIVNGNLAIGSGATAGMDFKGKILVLAENNINIHFQDTSTTSAFPTNDWVININDTTDGGDNYFEVKDVNADKTVFKVMAGAPNASLELQSNSNISLNTTDISEKLVVAGKVKSTKYIGSAEFLTNLPVTGTATVSNTGSTTIGADNNEDDNGNINFQIANQNKLVIESNGAVNNGVSNTDNLVNITGDTKVTQNLTANNLHVKKAMVATASSIETSLTFLSNIDIINKRVIYLNSDPGSTYYIQFLENAKKGQIITFINIHPTITSYMAFNNKNIILGKNHSATYLYDGATWHLINKVQ